ncbi:mandelate racemase/muconate lactonizing enzyme family protein [Paenibacillus nasutitermitis]|uniref:Dipeptide epimerase n=1 Tax=Paenibacillus nasutitermitis TaxID=1652958 RepID=A0A916ZHT5_9BACL|nr:mandelate racemase/muconate lactonizing enzyme family protein [Paenibacillus nasutitermitis]GGD98380.1 dipeptide epimerase [Paenibacillus nasutitermitis]
MKILSVEAVPINLPFQEPVSDMWGTYHSSNHGIVIIRSDSGEYGAGEIALAWFGGAHSLCHEVNTYWAPKLKGLDIRNMSHISDLMDHWSSFSKRHLLAKAGVEMALWDLLGKILGQPVYQLLGGKRRDKIRLTGGISMGDHASMVQTAIRKVGEGYKELKLKIGNDDRADLELVRMIRNAIPDSVMLRVDVNMAWQDVKAAKRLIDELTQYGVTIVEQPLHHERLSELAWLRQNTDALILIDEGAWDVHDAKRNLDAYAADLIHVYITEAGGVWGARKIFELASVYHIDCTIGSMPEGKIGAAASAHVAAAMSNLSGHASDIRGFTGYREDVTQEQLVIHEGELIVPDKPGLGVTIDFDQLSKLAV